MSNLRVVHQRKNQIATCNMMNPRQQPFHRRSKRASMPINPYGNDFARHSKNQISFADNFFLLSLKDEGFINAKYRLIVRDQLNISEYLEDPNKLVPWSELQVIVSPQPDLLECPICLYPPTAPRMDKCGHIYCFPCIMQFMKNIDHNSNSRKCAICDHIIEKQHLKRVALNPSSYPTVGNNINLSLIKKSVDCSSINPKDLSDMTDETLLKKHRFERLIPVSDQSLINIINEELENLLSQLAVSKVDDFSFELVPYLEICIKSVRSEQSEVYTRLKRSKSKEFSNKEQGSEEIVFYQSSDGQDVYLSGLNWRCLNSQFSEDLPLMIEAPVLEITRQVLTPTSRRKFRYLSHLPDGREILVVELNLSHLLSQEVRSKYSSEICAHKQKRQAKKELDRELTRLKIEQENRYNIMTEGFRLLGRADLSEPDHIPTADDFMPLSPQNADTSPQQSPSAALPCSFAAMTRAGAWTVLDKDGCAHLARRGEGLPIPPPPCGPGQSSHWPSLASTVQSPAAEAGVSRRRRNRHKTASSSETAVAAP